MNDVYIDWEMGIICFVVVYIDMEWVRTILWTCFDEMYVDGMVYVV